ncbi:MAG: glutamine-hydrolyzing GMP synthase [Spirochaetales bacterium]|nr:glutamine-hydrolyzing GMP synthase [Spirochaetales bacterium]
MDTILILDFGSQTTQLIGRRIRDLGVYSEIVPGETPLEGLLGEEIRGIVLSGSPFSVYEQGSPRPDPRVFELSIPVLGICYGAQRMTQDLGGQVRGLARREYGRAVVEVEEPSPLFDGVPARFVSWMSHGDTIVTPAPGFRAVAKTEYGLPAVIVHERKAVFGLQFHPEVSHCEHGDRILENFAVGICGARRQWGMEAYLRQVSGRIRERVGERIVLLLASGGVDSTVLAALLLQVLGPQQVHLMYIDSGLMRLNESEEVTRRLEALGAQHLHVVDASERFLSGLAGVPDPERKREIIGDLFMEVQAKEIARAGVQNAFLAQGTLYTDLIESGKGVGGQAHVIKSHHNVRSPLVEEKRRQGLLLEPLADLYKDEVRRLGLHLGLDEESVYRHPFPGPGLAVRIPGEVTREKCRILQAADAIYVEELRRRGLYREIWQAFSVLLPTRSVGVAGDVRRYGFVLALRAVVSRDGMTADVFPFPPVDLLEISARITNQVPEIGRVVYDVSSKPPATIEWE